RPATRPAAGGRSDPAADEGPPAAVRGRKRGYRLGSARDEARTAVRGRMSQSNGLFLAFARERTETTDWPEHGQPGRLEQNVTVVCITNEHQRAGGPGLCTNCAGVTQRLAQGLALARSRPNAGRR